jgi:hypothetical protein
MNRSTPNLPSRNFHRTARFYYAFGFREAWRDDEWMVLERDGIALEFFPDPTVDPLRSRFSCCLRLDDLDGFYSICLGTGLPETNTGAPRLHKPAVEESGLRIGALIDPDGTLLRLIQN